VNRYEEFFVSLFIGPPKARPENNIKNALIIGIRVLFLIICPLEKITIYLNKIT